MAYWVDNTEWQSDVSQLPEYDPMRHAYMQRLAELRLGQFARFYRPARRSVDVIHQSGCARFHGDYCDCQAKFRVRR